MPVFGGTWSHQCPINTSSQSISPPSLLLSSSMQPGVGKHAKTRDLLTPRSGPLPTHELLLLKCLAGLFKSAIKVTRGLRPDICRCSSRAPRLKMPHCPRKYVTRVRVTCSMNSRMPIQRGPVLHCKRLIICSRRRVSNLTLCKTAQETHPFIVSPRASGSTNYMPTFTRHVADIARATQEQYQCHSWLRMKPCEKWISRL